MHDETAVDSELPPVGRQPMAIRRLATRLSLSNEGIDRLAPWAAFTAVALTCLGVLSLLSPDLMMTPSLVTYGDLGAHLYPIHEFVTRLLPGGSISGWAQGWYSGIPLYTFYFPLPPVIVAALTPLLGFEVALKWMIAFGPLLLPPATYVLLRSMGLGRWTSVGGMAMGSTFLIMNSFVIYGGNILSNYIGEFSYSISLAFSIFYLAAVLNAGRKNTNGTLAASAFLALTALSHVLTTGMVVASTLPLLAKPRFRGTILRSWFLGFLFAGFWAFPFLARLNLSSGPQWIHDQHLQWTMLLPTEILVFLPLAVVGAVWLVRRVRWLATPLLMFPVLAVAFYLVPQERIHFTRWLPYGYYAIHVFGGLAIGAGIERFFRLGARWALLGSIAGIIYVVGINNIRDVDYIRGFVRNSMEGYEAAELADEYSDLVDQISGLPPGRVFYEETDRQKDYGSLLALQLLPYWSPDHPVLGGLWAESAVSYPYALRASREVGGGSDSDVTAAIQVPGPFDFDRGMDHAKLQAARYFIAYSDRARELAAARRDLSPVLESEEWTVFEFADVATVIPLRGDPMVYPGRNFQDVATLWFDSLYTSGRLVAADGPAAWPRVGADLVVPDSVPPLGGSTRPVTEVEIGQESISFRTEAIGVPHLVRISYFPNWLAVGAEGPYRVSPAYMVVIPREEEVSLEFVDTWVEWTGRGMTLLGLLAALFVTAGGGGSTVPRHRRYYG